MQQFCSKQRYDNQEQAKRAMRRLLTQHRRYQKGHGRPNTYKCQHCGGWHWGHAGHRA